MAFDVIVIGGGIAGLMAAIEAKEENNRVALITKGNIFKSNSSMVSGGINATLDPNDSESIEKHIQDTLSGAKGLGDKKAATYMCQKAPYLIKKLVEYGVEFDKNEKGEIAQRSFGGGSIKRTCYVGDKTGAALTQTLIKKAKETGVELLVNHYLLDIVVTKNSVAGISVLKRADSLVETIPTKALVLAGGGFAGMYKGFSTNAPDYTGDTLAVALRAGLELKDMEFVQFHPTGFRRSGYLVSEAARGEGAYLVNSKGERFVDELSTRDIVAKAIAKEINEGKEVFIDLRHIDEAVIKERLPSLYKSGHLQEGVDIAHELLPIKPVAHYTMGGIATKKYVETEIKGCFVCGENAVSGVHGANRLGGNSLLEGVVFGELSGKRAKNYAKKRGFLDIDLETAEKNEALIEKIFDKDTTKNFNAMRTSMGNTLFKYVGIVRDHDTLLKAFDYLKYLRREAENLHTIDKEKTNNVELIAILELRNALEVCEAVVLSAQKREETRGAHSRSDFETTDSNFEKHIRVKEFQKGFFKVEFEPSPIRQLLNKLIN